MIIVHIPGYSLCLGLFPKWFLCINISLYYDTEYEGGETFCLRSQSGKTRIPSHLIYCNYFRIFIIQPPSKSSFCSIISIFYLRINRKKKTLLNCALALVIFFWESFHSVPIYLHPFTSCRDYPNSPDCSFALWPQCSVVSPSLCTWNPTWNTCYYCTLFQQLIN